MMSMNTSMEALPMSILKRGEFHGSSGFSLVELIITMSIAAILLTLAVPSFTTLIKDNRQVTQASRWWRH